MQQDIVCQRCSTVNEFYEVTAGPHLSAYCLNCNAYIKHLPQNKPTTIHFGKYKGRLLSELTADEDLRYLTWLSGTNIKPALKEAILTHIKNS